MAQDNRPHHGCYGAFTPHGFARCAAARISGDFRPNVLASH